jgi:hypothetical protein
MLKLLLDPENAHTLPEVIFLSRKLSYLKLPLLYKNVDAFVSAAHGEGWGLPLCEGNNCEMTQIMFNRFNRFNLLVYLIEFMRLMNRNKKTFDSDIKFISISSLIFHSYVNYS